jgi:uncharacterized membrane protein
LPAVVAILLAVSLVLALAWVPVFRFFFRAWRERANPISLAICFLVLFAIYTNGAAVLLLAFGSSSLDAVIALRVVDLAVLVFFYLSFRWAKHRWKPANGEERKKRRPGTLL